MNEEQVSLWLLAKYAFDQEEEGRREDYPSPRALEEAYPSLPALDEKVETGLKQLRRQERGGARRVFRWAKRVLIAAAVLASLLLATLLTSADLRAGLVNTILEWTDRDLGIRFEIEGEPLSALPEGYGPHYIPEGFVLDEEASYRNELNGNFMQTYQTADQNEILDISVSVLENGSAFWLDNEHTEFEHITFMDAPAYLGTRTTVAGYQNYVLVWAKDGMEHYVQTSTSLSELFEIAENIY